MRGQLGRPNGKNEDGIAVWADCAKCPAPGGGPAKPTGAKIPIRAPKWLKWLGLAVAAAVIGCALVVILAYFMISQRPGSYQPRILSDPEQEQAETLGLRKSAEFYNSFYLYEPFTITLSEQLINDLLVLEATQQLVDEYVSGQVGLRRPQVKLGAGTIEVMGQVRYRGVDTVMTVGLQPGITEDGEVQIGLASVRVGGLRLPLSAVCDYLADWLSKGQINGNLATDTVPAVGGQWQGPVLEDPAAQLAAATDELARDQRVTLPAAISMNRRGTEWAEITGISIRSGLIELSVKPVLLDEVAW